VAAQASVPLLEARRLTRVFGHGAQALHAVDDVSFSIHSGEALAVVGESGSGKTTLARLLLRLLEPTAGRILLHGQEATQLRTARALRPYWGRVQGVFQDPFAACNQFYTIRRLLMGALRVSPVRRTAREREQAIAGALEEVGLIPEDLLPRYAHQLSGGQLQRVMIARALVVGPEILIADEPTSMLDASLRVTVLNLLRDAGRRHNMSVVFITHDLGQAYYACDRVLVMYQGRLVEQGAIEEVLSQPQHEYTRRLLADVPRLHGWGAVFSGVEA